MEILIFRIRWVRCEKEGRKGEEEISKPICYSIASISWDIRTGIFKNLTRENHTTSGN